MSLLQLVNAAKAVDSLRRKPEVYRTRTFFSKFDLWRYVPVFDEKLCDRCREYAMTQFFKGTELRKEFPYLTIRDEDTINAKVHPNCRCELWRILDFTWYMKALKKMS